MRNNNQKTKDNFGDLLTDVAFGLVAGAVGTFVMGKVTNYMYRHEDSEARQKYQEVTGGKYVPERTAETIEKTFGLEATKKQRQLLAKGSHWSVGLGAGATYALLRRRFDYADWGQGLAFGAAFWLFFDEGLTWLTGLAESPQEYPWQAHARGLVGHLVYGLVADTTLDLFDQINNQLPIQTQRRM